MHCKVDNPGGQIKSTQNAHLDNKTFAEAAQTFAQSAGLTVNVDPSLENINREYWSMGNENFLQWGQRMAKALGATFKVQGTTAAFVPRGSTSSAGGLALGLFNAIVLSP